MARWVSSMRAAGYAAVPTVLANSDESQHVVNRDRRFNAALASIASHMCVLPGRWEALAKGLAKPSRVARPPLQTLGGVP